MLSSNNYILFNVLFASNFQTEKYSLILITFSLKKIFLETMDNIETWDKIFIKSWRVDLVSFYFILSVPLKTIPSSHLTLSFVQILTINLLRATTDTWRWIHIKTLHTINCSYQVVCRFMTHLKQLQYDSNSLVYEVAESEFTSNLAKCDVFEKINRHII